MKAKDLRNSVLQLAVQGKLVAQDSNDEPANILLERIKVEKDRLEKERKIRKQKSLPSVSEEEIPFDIPDSWKWVRLGEVGTWASGATPQKSNKQYYKNGSIPWLRTGDLNDGLIKQIPLMITPLALEKTSAKLNKPGAVLIAMYGATIGKTGILEFEATTNQACCACHLYSNLSNRYLQQYLLSQKENFRKKGEGGAQPNISREKIITYLYPLPPLAEQQRIVAKLEQIMPLIDEYDKLETELTKLETEFPEKLKKSILQYAVQGKLVEQLTDDEPASVLLERIVEEKERLIKENKIKKQKPLPPITEDDIPFDIPASWEWVRLGEICQINPRNTLDKDMDVSFIPMALIDDKYNNSHSSEVRKWEKVKSGYTHFKEGDICIAKITPCFENKKSAILCNLKNGYGAGTTELHILRPYTNKLNKEYLLWFVKTEQFINDGTSTFTGTAGQQRIGKDFVQNYPFPLPPFVEQQRIVEKVNELLSLCDVLLDEKALRARKVRKQIDNVLEFPQGSNDEDTEIVFAARGDANKSDLDIAEEIFNGLFDDK